MDFAMVQKGGARRRSGRKWKGDAMLRAFAALGVLVAVLAPGSGAEAANQELWDICNGKDTESAIKACTLILAGEETYSNYAVAFTNRGYAHNNKGDFDRAIADLTRAIALDPKNAVSFSNRGWAYQQKGDYDQAIADLTRAIALDSKNAVSFGNRGSVYSDKGDFDRAIADLTRAIALDPKNAISFNNRGLAYEYKGDYNRAIADQTRAIELDPNEAAHYVNRAAALILIGDYDHAIADNTRGIDLDPKNAGAFSNRARAYLEKGEYSFAIADAIRAIELKPDGANAYRHRGVAYLKTGRLKEARADLAKALEFQPDYQDAKRALAELEKIEGAESVGTPSPSAAQKAAAESPKPTLQAPASLPQTPSIPRGKRVALVIGNSEYRNVARLENPSNDANLVANTLRRLGFVLIGGGPQTDLDKASFDAAVQEFGNHLEGADVGLFYYAGHGMQLRGQNYLIPISANPTKEGDVDFQMVDMGVVLRQMEGAGTRLNLVMLDACRNNPFGGRGLRAGGGGLAQMRAPEGTLISFATQPGNVALDGSEGHSPYTRALAEIIESPGVDIFQTFNRVGLKVKRATGGAQQPWLSSSPIEGVFYFNPGA